jgi:hypothetical protein
MKFLNPNKPIATCTSETCNNCNVRSALHCHFTLRDLIPFLLSASPDSLSSVSRRPFYDIKDVSLFPVHEFCVSTEHG